METWNGRRAKMLRSEGLVFDVREQSHDLSRGLHEQAFDFFHILSALSDTDITTSNGPSLDVLTIPSLCGTDRVRPSFGTDW